ncbi:MAG: hypothetical protein ACPIOQ_17110 [Promethearchaeia archaeon]
MSVAKSGGVVDSAGVSGPGGRWETDGARRRGAKTRLQRAVSV